MPKWTEKKLRMLNLYVVYAYLCESHGEYFWKEGSHFPFVSRIHNTFTGKCYQSVNMIYLCLEETKITTSDRQVENEAFKMDKVKPNKGKTNSR